MLAFRQMLLLAIFCILLPLNPLHAQTASFDTDQALKISQDAIGQSVGDYALRNRMGRLIKLEELTAGKPYVLSMVYTSCYHICSIATRSLADIIEKATDTFGADSFNVVTIGFDSRFDKPRTMAAFAKQQDLEDVSNWYFLSTTPSTIQQLIKNVGFTYILSPRGYDHVIQATVVDAKREIYRQVYGETISTPLLLEPLKELILGQPPAVESLTENIVRRVRLFCTSYDPTQDAYRFDFSIFINMFIGGTIILTGFVLVYKEKKKSKSKEKA
jgi:protein SCO1